jgi:hypothetical protein
MAARPKLAMAWDKDPVTMASRILGVSNPVTRTENRHTIGTASREEIRAELKARGWTPPAVLVAEVDDGDDAEVE